MMMTANSRRQSNLKMRMKHLMEQHLDLLQKILQEKLQNLKRVVIKPNKISLMMSLRLFGVQSLRPFNRFKFTRAKIQELNS